MVQFESLVWITREVYSWFQVRYQDHRMDFPSWRDLEAVC